MKQAAFSAFPVRLKQHLSGQGISVEKQKILKSPDYAQTHSISISFYTYGDEMLK